MKIAQLTVILALAPLAACGPSYSADRGRAVVSVDNFGAPVPTPAPAAPPARAAVDAAVAAEPPVAVEPTVDAGRPSLDAGPPEARASEAGRSDAGRSDAGRDVMAADAGAEVMVEATPPPFAVVSFAPAPTAVDLTASGTIDWVHFGYRDPTAVNRKRGVTPLIRMTTVANATLDHYADRPVRFSWSDGVPTGSVTSINDGVNVGEVERGFQLHVEGNPARPRRLELYVGAWGARARLDVRLARKGEPTAPLPLLYSDGSLSAERTASDRLYRVVFQLANPGDQLVVSWVVANVTETFGNVTLQAAVLAE